jgi:hypothetical protein
VERQEMADVGVRPSAGRVPIPRKKPMKVRGALPATAGRVRKARTRRAKPGSKCIFSHQYPIHIALLVLQVAR